MTRRGCRLPTLGGAGRLVERLSMVWFLLGATYQFLLALVALEASTRSGPHSQQATSHVSTDEPASVEMVIFVPAHDEAKLIGSCLDSLLTQQPLLNLRDVVVIADNCGDDTVRIAAHAGVTVWERTDLEHRGKGHALVWALARMQEERPGVAMVGVIDADCRASPNLVACWSAAIASGDAAVQADYWISNPEASSSAARRWAGFALRNRVRGLAKERLGLSCGLSGTGMAFNSDLLAELPWTSVSVTEDAEYHARLVEAGRRVRFLGEAWVSSPAPVTEAEARVQQLRWESGNVAVASKMTFPLMKGALRHRDPGRLDLACEQLVPPQSLLCLGLVGIGILAGLQGRRREVIATMVGAGAEAGYVVLGLTVAQAPQAVWRSLASAPALMMSKLGQLALIGSGRGSRDWVRSPRAATRH